MGYFGTKWWVSTMKNKMTVNHDNQLNSKHDCFTLCRLCNLDYLYKYTLYKNEKSLTFWHDLSFAMTSKTSYVYNLLTFVLITFTVGDSRHSGLSVYSVLRFINSFTKVIFILISLTTIWKWKFRWTCRDLNKFLPGWTSL